MIDTIFTGIPNFYSWLSSYQILSGFTLMDFIIGCFVVTVLVGVVLPFFSGGDD